MIIYTHNDCLKKFNGHAHPEKKERLESIINSIKSSNTKIQNLSEVSLVKKVIIHITCLIPFLLGFIIPLFYTINNSISIYHKTDFENLIQLTSNSIYVSFIAAVLIVILALFFQYTEKISKSKINNFVSQLISLGYAIPGAVIALALIIFFSGINKLFPSIYLLGSLYILIYALIVRFLAVGKSPIKSSFEKHPESFDDTAKNLGLGPFKILQKIHLPINLSSIQQFLILGGSHDLIYPCFNKL